MVLLDFNAAAFDPRVFSESNIALPPHIARSVGKRQAEYFHGRLAARLALERAGLPVQDVGTGHQREPLWPAGVVGSITHHACRAAAVAQPSGSCRGIGIDIELPATPDTQQSVAAAVLDASETRLLAAHRGAWSPAVLYALAFSAKESFYKAVHAHVGRYFGFEAIRMTHLDMEGGRFNFTVNQPLSKEWQPGASGGVHVRVLPEGDVLTAFVW